MEIAQVTVGLAFLAGLASFLSPCVFSLIPAYIGYLGGRAVGGEATDRNRFITFTHGLAFVLGFSAVFITLGAASSAFMRATPKSISVASRAGWHTIPPPARSARSWPRRWATCSRTGKSSR